MIRLVSSIFSSIVRGNRRADIEDDAYSPRRSARNKRKINRKNIRSKPYPPTMAAQPRTRTTRASKAEPDSSPIPPTPLRSRVHPAHIPQPLSSPSTEDMEDDVSSGLRGEMRQQAKVKEFRRFLLTGPKRLSREPRFDMKVFQ